MTVLHRSSDDRASAPEGRAGGPAPAPPAGALGPGAPLWRRIHAVLSDEILSGRWPPGARLPSETALARRFGVNRHTLRRAMALLGEEGRVHVRRGAGATVTERVADYPIGPRTRFAENLRAAGKAPSRTLLARETAVARRGEAEALELPPGTLVHGAETLSAADGVPVAAARTVWPAERLPGFLDRLAESGSVTEALAACGVHDYVRAWTRLTAERPGAILARHLKIGEGTALIRAESLNVDAEGRPIEYGLTWFCTDRMPVMVESDARGARIG